MVISQLNNSDTGPDQGPPSDVNSQIARGRSRKRKDQQTCQQAVSRTAESQRRAEVRMTTPKGQGATSNSTTGPDRPYCQAAR